MICLFFVAWITAQPVVLVVVPPNYAPPPPAVSIPMPIPGEIRTVRL